MGEGVALCVRGAEDWAVTSARVGKYVGRRGAGEAAGDRPFDWQAEQTRHASVNSRIDRFIYDS